MGNGIKRWASCWGALARFANTTTRIDHLYQDPHESDPRLCRTTGDLTDSTNLIRADIVLKSCKCFLPFPPPFSFRLMTLTPVGGTG